LKIKSFEQNIVNYRLHIQQLAILETILWDELFFPLPFYQMFPSASFLDLPFPKDGI
jgi:hypothetical protein